MRRSTKVLRSLQLVKGFLTLPWLRMQLEKRMIYRFLLRRGEIIIIPSYFIISQTLAKRTSLPQRIWPKSGPMVSWASAGFGAP